MTSLGRPSVRFEDGDGIWIAERDCVRFIGQTDLGGVGFLITADALAELINPDLDGIDPDAVAEAFEAHQDWFIA